MEREAQVMVCHILDATNDGDDLTDIELKVVEWAVNGVLSKAGLLRLREMFLHHCGREHGA